MFICGVCLKRSVFLDGLQTPIWYIVEQRIPPSLEWVKLTTDLKDTEFQVSKYSATKDHYFRVRAANEFGIAEPSMPAMIRRKEGTVFYYRNTTYLRLCLFLKQQQPRY